MSREHPISLTPVQLRELAKCVTQQITLDVAHIDLNLCRHEPDPHSELFTVYTSVDGGYSTRLVLCADRKFFHRLTENMMGAPTDDPEDLEEYAKEYFNVLCGRLVGEIYRVTKIGARFQPPSFAHGHYTSVLSTLSEPGQAICFTSPQAENIMVTHGTLCSA